jgi:hypothetical protein
VDLRLLAFGATSRCVCAHRLPSRVTAVTTEGDTIEALQALLADLVDSHRRLVEVVATLHADVVELADRLLDEERTPSAREDAEALRRESAQAKRHARRLVAESEALRGPSGLTPPS